VPVWRVNFAPVAPDADTMSDLIEFDHGAVRVMPGAAASVNASRTSSRRSGRSPARFLPRGMQGRVVEFLGGCPDTRRGPPLKSYKIRDNLRKASSSTRYGKYRLVHVAGRSLSHK
jgi:hypothetical protein